MMLRFKFFALFVPVVFGAMLSGCAVPQPRGEGQLMHKVEPTTHRGYWLYLPEDYVANNGQRSDGRKWPLVMTFHGMKPWDNAKPQAREWQEEADRYGYVVCAPDVVVCDMLLTFPPKLGKTLTSDEEASLAIMDEVFRKTDADPQSVLATSWSSGGFLAHYMVNRHPERFSCLATRQSNFSEDLMDPRQVAKYRNMPIGLYHTTNDFAVCKRDTLRAIAWYKSLGVPGLESGTVQAFGHERLPEVAADFFARSCGATPKTPPQKLARIRINDIGQEQLAQAAPKNSAPVFPLPRADRPALVNYADSSTPVRAYAASPSPQASSPLLFEPTPSTPKSTRRTALTAANPRPNPVQPKTRPSPSQTRTTTPGRSPDRNTHDRLRPVGDPAETGLSSPTDTAGDARSLHTYRRPVHTAPARTEPKPTPPRKAAPRRRTATSSNPLAVEVSATIGITPLLIDYAVKMPAPNERGADFLWTDNGMPIGNGPSGQKVLTHTGEHNISVLVITKDDREYRASTRVTVLSPVKSDS